MELTEAFALLRDFEPELSACYRVCSAQGRHRLIEAVTYGCPDGIMFGLVLTGLGMQKERWEQLLLAGPKIGAIVREYWSDPAVLVGAF